MIITQTNNEIISLSLHLIEVKVLALALEYALTNEDQPDLKQLAIEVFAGKRCKEDGISIKEDEVLGLIKSINTLLDTRAKLIVGSTHAALKAYKDSGTVQ